MPMHTLQPTKYNDNYLQLSEKCNKTSKYSHHFPAFYPSLSCTSHFGCGFKHLNGEIVSRKKKKAIINK